MKLSEIIELMQYAINDIGDIEFDETYDVGIKSSDNKHSLSIQAVVDGLEGFGVYPRNKFLWVDGNRYMFNENKKVVKK